MESLIVVIQAEISPISEGENLVAFILPPLPPFSTTIRMSWRIVSEPISRSESNDALGFSVPPLVVALPVKMSPDGRRKFQKNSKSNLKFLNAVWSKRYTVTKKDNRQNKLQAYFISLPFSVRGVVTSRDLPSFIPLQLFTSKIH